MGRRALGKVWLWLFALLMLGIPGSAGAENPRRGPVQLGDSSLPLVAETVRVTIDHQHAKATIQRIFQNRTSAQMEGRFSYHAGQSASVTGFAYWNGEQKIVGEVFEKTVARQVYDQTVSRRADPGLLEADGEGSFSFKVFPIAPAERKRVELELQQWLPRRRGQIEFTLPVERSDADIDIIIEDARGLRSLSSPTHQISQSAAGKNRVRVRARGGKRATKQLVLRWTPDDRPKAAGGRVFPLRAYIHRDAGQDAYVVMSLAAQPVVDRKSVVAKDVTLVLDHSGSMSGEPWRRAQEAAISVVRRLSKTDRLNVIVFDDTTDKLFNKPRTADGQTRAQAIEFIERTIDGGGTDIALALGDSFAAQHRDARPKNVLFITDGVSDARAALDAAERDTGDVRVFTMGLGEGVERPLLSRLAKSKRGNFTFVESADVLESRVAAVYRHIEAPVLVGLTLSADGPTLTQMYPPKLPDLFQADELRVVARVRGSGPLHLELRGEAATGPVRLVATVNVPARARRPWVGRLWANARIDHLGEGMALHGETQEMRDETIELALAYDVVTQYTSFLAIPESELTWQTARTLAEARERKMAVRAKMADAQMLQESEDDGVVIAGGTSLAKTTAEEVAMPEPMDAPMADYDEADAPMLSSRRARRDSARHERSAIRRGKGSPAGCASCTAGSTPDPLGLSLPLLLLGLRRRRG